MALDKYITLIIEERTADLDTTGAVPTINYALEDEQDFEQKKSAEAFGIELPATLANQAGLNGPDNPSVLDYSPDDFYSKPMAARLVANGHEILVGKFFYLSAITQNGIVKKYKGKLYGLNGDWVIDLKEKTLYDFLNPVRHTFDAATIQASWQYNGRSEQQDFVYAPVRYRKAFGADVPVDPADPDSERRPDDRNCIINDMKPALSVYWFLYRGLRSAGYRLVSQFMDTAYYRRGVLPWTWGGFDFLDDTRWEPLKFRAGMASSMRFTGDQNDVFPNFNVVDTYPGGFDNSGLYDWYGPAASLPNSMVWKYPNTIPPALGKVRAGYSVSLSFNYKVQRPDNYVEVYVLWYHNGVFQREDKVLEVRNRATLGVDVQQGMQFVENFFETDIQPGDWIAARVKVKQKQTLIGFARNDIQIEQFQLDFIKLTAGSTIDFNNYPKFKNYKWLDLLRGEIDLFDLEVQTDPIRREVYIEPRHDYRLYEGGEWKTYPGYFNRRQLDWTEKVDHNRESELEVFSDYEREFLFKFRDDPQDGGLKKIQDRNQAVIGQAKYVLPERFKTGKKERPENRFYSPVMHYEHEPWRHVTGMAPQMICIIPENISNTSSDASENTFGPKRAYYKGLVTGSGGWSFNGIVRTELPFLFAVNYKPGGETDPVLSYGSQIIAGVKAKGLFETFFIQRMAIISRGRRYNPLYVRLNNYDISNFLHRESIIVDDTEYLLTAIRNYNPIGESSTACTLWAYHPVTEEDVKNTFPSLESLQGRTSNNSFDIKYHPALLLSSDIPK